MGTKIAINRVVNAVLYADGNSMLGKAEEITLPDLKAKMAAHKSLGTVGEIETFSGFEKLTGKIKMTSYYKDALVKFANVFKPVQLQARASMQVHEAGGVVREVPVVCLVTATFNKFPFGALKQHDNPEIEFEYGATYVKLVIDGQDVLEYDVLANIYKVDGADLLADYRLNTGA